MRAKGVELQTPPFGEDCPWNYDNSTLVGVLTLTSIPYCKTRVESAYGFSA
jgi:hypothetical protein